jgi:hypothetical protein
VNQFPHFSVDGLDAKTQLFGGGMAIGHDPGGLGLVAGSLFGLGGLSHLAA